MNIFSTAIYLLAAACVFVNVYVLLNRSDTIHYLRIYHLAVGVLMISAGALQIAFMVRAKRIAKLKNPYRLPRPTMVSAFALTVGIALGYAYFLVFNIAYSNCDKMIDATGAQEQWQEAVYNLMMISFCILTLVYIWQRSFFGSQSSTFDLITRKWVNVVLTIVWIKIVVYKGYLSYQELCQRKEISGYWCPIVQRPYTCDPEKALKGTQKIWYYLHKGLLNSAIISCASEFFPVMLVAHWLACGRAEQRADELIRRRQEKKSVRRMLHGMIGDVSKVYGVDPTAQHRRELPTLDIPLGLASALLLLASITAVLTLLRWFVGLYFAIKPKRHLLLLDTRFGCWWPMKRTFYSKSSNHCWYILINLTSVFFNYDLMMPSLLDNFVECTASGCQLILFGTLWWWTRRVITFKRWDPHHKAESRGDLVLIGGSATFMTIKLFLQLLELHFQRVDAFLPLSEAILRASSLVLIQCAEWLQFCSLQRVMALHFEDVYATRRFLPIVTLAAIIVNWVGFGSTFFETNSIKYQLGLQNHHFSQSTLISMIFTQTIYPADYLFCFTAAGCWTDVLLRYTELGLFQLGPPMELDELEELEQQQRRRSSSEGAGNGTVWGAQTMTAQMKHHKNHFGNGLHAHHQQRWAPPPTRTARVGLKVPSSLSPAHNRPDRPMNFACGAGAANDNNNHSIYQQRDERGGAEEEFSAGPIKVVAEEQQQQTMGGEQERRGGGGGEEEENSREGGEGGGRGWRMRKPQKEKTERQKRAKEEEKEGEEEEKEEFGRSGE